MSEQKLSELREAEETFQLEVAYIGVDELHTIKTKFYETLRKELLGFVLQLMKNPNEELMKLLLSLGKKQSNILEADVRTISVAPAKTMNKNQIAATQSLIDYEPTLAEKVSTLSKATKMFAQQAYNHGGDTALALMGIEPSFQLMDPKIISELNKRADMVSIGALGAMTKKVINIVNTEYAVNGKPPKDVARSIVKQAPQFTKTYANLVAHQETLIASMAARTQTFMNSGIKKKRWMSHNFKSPLDPRPTHALANSQIVDMDKPFIIGGAALMFPGDPNGPPRETMRCHCVMLPVIPDEFEPSDAWMGGWDDFYAKNSNFIKFSTNEPTTSTSSVVADILDVASGNIVNSTQNFTVFAKTPLAVPGAPSFAAPAHVAKWASLGYPAIPTSIKSKRGFFIWTKFGCPEPGSDTWAVAFAPLKKEPKAKTAVKKPSAKDLDGENFLMNAQEMFDEMAFLKDGKYLGGAGRKSIYIDNDGDEWIFKPATTKSGNTKEPFRAYAQEAATKLSSVLQSAREQVLVAAVDDPSGQIGTLQKMIKGKLTPVASDLSNLTPEQIVKLQEEHVVDWLLGNFDSHHKNFMITSSGKLLGLDKEQSFRYLKHNESHEMSINYHPNSQYGEAEPIYNTLFKMFKTEKIKLDLNVVLPMIQKLEAMPDAVYREMFRKYAESLPSANTDEILDLIVARKKTLRAEYKKFYSSIDPANKYNFSNSNEFYFSDEKKFSARPKPKAVAKPAASLMSTASAPAQKDVFGDSLKKRLGSHKLKTVFEPLDGADIELQQAKVTRGKFSHPALGNNFKGYRVSFKVRDSYSDFLDEAQSNWRREYYKLPKMNADGSLDYTAGPSKGVAFQTATSKGVAAQLSIDKDHWALHNSVDLLIKADTYEEFTKKLAEATTSLKLSKLLEATTAFDEDVMKMARLLYIHAPELAANAKSSQDVIDSFSLLPPKTRKLKDSLKKVSLGEEYSTFYDSSGTIETAIKDAGGTCFWHSVYNTDLLPAILSGGGLKATTNRFKNGINTHGTSSDRDIETGGADSVFVRVSNDHLRSSALNGRLLISLSSANRTDYFGYNADYYGTTSPLDSRYGHYKTRKTPDKVAKKALMNNGANEFMFREIIPVSDLIGFKCYSSDKSRYVQACRSAGITEVNGKPVEDFFID